MPIVRSPRTGAGAALLGHGLALAGFLQPWVVGQFGAREQLTGLDLTRLAGDAFSQGIAGDMLTIPVARIVLLVVPLSAANALALLLSIRLGLLPSSVAHRAAAWLAAPIAMVSGVGICLVALSMNDGPILAGPGLGIMLVTGGALLAAASLWLAGPRAATED